MDVDNSCSSASSSRQRFYIELKPGETTIVSWKKLIKEANSSPPPPPPPATQHQQPPLTATAEQTQKVQAALDEYFLDEKPTAKCSDLIVNREASELLKEPDASSHCQLNKRQKYLPKAVGEKLDHHTANKHIKLGHARLKVAGKNAPLEGQPSSYSQASVVRHSHYRIPNSDAAAVLLVDSDDTEKQRIGTAQSKNLVNKVKEANEFSGASHLKYGSKNTSRLFNPQSKKICTDSNDLHFANHDWPKEENGSNGLPDLNIPATPEPVKAASNLKDISGFRPKGTTLERAIRELEKVVAESRPPKTEVQDADTSSMAIKRRLPREVKLKLAKVARLAQSSQGKISEELINRLMGILGHLMQLRTLKRNLREMVVLGLSAKQEKADRCQQIKEEVIEMIKLQVPKQSDGATDEFQQAFGCEGKGFLKERFNMENALEDKIYDLYDSYIQGMDEDKGPQIRKLYIELAELWPDGSMDNHGIKRAISRAKERRRASSGNVKVHEKVRRTNFSMRRTESMVPELKFQSLQTIPSASTFNHNLTSSSMDLAKQEKMDSILKEQLKQD